MEAKKHTRDYGIVLGQALTGACAKCIKRPEDDDETQPLLDDGPSGTQDVVGGSARPYSPPGWGQVFTRQSNINLAAYTMLAMHSVAFDQLLPVFMHHPAQEIRNNPDVQLPFKFSGGFGIGQLRCRPIEKTIC